MLTLIAAMPFAMNENIKAITSLLAASKSLATMSLGGISINGETLQATAVVHEAANNQLIAFLKAYRWLETEYEYPHRPTDTSLQIEFLEKEKHEITSWLIVAPQRKMSFGRPLTVKGVGDFAVKERHRVEGRGFQVFGEPVHRTIAEYLAGIEPGASALTKPNAATIPLRNKHRGVCLLYPVREQEKDDVSIGFELLFPENDMSFDINFTVRRKGEKAQIVVQDSNGAS